MLPSVLTGRLTLADVAAGHARTRPSSLALVDGDVHLTWSDVRERVARTTGALRGLGVSPGARVLWLGQNSFRLQELLLACSRLGAVLCPANWRQQPDELSFVVEDLDPRVVVWQEEEVGPTVLAADRGGATWVQHDGDEYERLVADAEPDGDDHLVGSDDPVLAVYTSAFTGRPAAAMLSSRAVLAQSFLLAPWMGIDPSYVFLNSGPLFHIGTFMSNLATFAVGGTNVFVARSDGEAICRAIERERCTSGFVVGPMVDAIVEANADGRYDLSSFRGKRGVAAFDAMVGGHDESAWGRHPGGYGQTEVMGMATFNLLGVGGVGTHGRPSPLVQLRVVDPDDVDVPTGETGELVVRGATVMNAYWHRPERNEDVARGGWHHTGDLGRYEVDGTVTFIGPKQRMLKSAAENIYPAEVEGCLRSHPAVADVAVIGVPDDTWVQRVKAIVVARPDTTVTADDLVAHCRQRIASYKKPREVAFVDDLPRLRTGAVDYDELDRRFGGGGYPGGTTRSA